MLFKFIFPLAPFFHLYAKSIYEKLSWVLYYLIPYLAISYLFDVNLLAAIISILAIYSVYDIGYIYNNAETIKNETKPTLRYSSNELVFYEKNKLLIYFVKFFFAVIFCFLLSYYFSYNFTLWLFCLTLILIIFFIYNSIRSKINFYLQIFLTISRFSFPLFLLCNFTLNDFIFTIMLFPLPNFLERTKIKVNNFPYKIEDISKFRTIYYLFLLVISVFIYNMQKTDLWFLILSSYYFFYRSVYYFISFFKR